MRSDLSNLTRNETELMLGIITKLYCNQDLNKLREDVAEDLLDLLKADFLASYIWNQKAEVFENAVYINMSPENLHRYESYYQFRDPITSLLQARRRTTPVYDVMAKEDLEKTEFFNDFLMKDGLHHGINVYAFDGELNIGDLRIWRAKHRPDFGKEEISLLDTLLPHFTNALRNVRIIEAAQGMAGFWSDLLDNTGTAVFLFNERGDLFHRNKSAREIENDLSESAYLSFQKHVRLLSRKKNSLMEWGAVFLIIIVDRFSI